MDDDNQILTEADVAGVLKMTDAEVSALFESGDIPGRRIGNHWFVTRRQLVTYIEQADKPQPKPTRADSLNATLFNAFPNAPQPDNSWVCEHCRRVNPADRVVCQDCGEARLAPLINYVPFRRSR